MHPRSFLRFRIFWSELNGAQTSPLWRTTSRSTTPSTLRWRGWWAACRRLAATRCADPLRHVLRPPPVDVTMNLQALCPAGEGVPKLQEQLLGNPGQAGAPVLQTAGRFSLFLFLYFAATHPLHDISPLNPIRPWRHSNAIKNTIMRLLPPQNSLCLYAFVTIPHILCHACKCEAACHNLF